VNTTTFRIATQATRLVSLSLLSPLAGFALEVLLARVYGASGLVDAFRIASLILLLGLNLFFTQLLPHIVVPMFLDCRVRKGEKEAWETLLSLSSLMAYLGVGSLVVLCFHPEPILQTLGPGLPASISGDAVILLYCYSASFILILWSGILSSILYTYGLFWLNRVTPIVISVSTIGALALFGERAGAVALGGGALTGSVAVALIHFISARKLSAGSRIESRSWLIPGYHQDLIRNWRVSLPVILALLNSQAVGILLYRALSLMGTGSAALYGYGLKLTHLVYTPGAALVTVVFPSLSRAQAREAREEFEHLSDKAVRMVLFLTVPSAAVLWGLRFHTATVLFGGGALSKAELTRVGDLFGILLIGAPAGALVALLTRTYASLRSNVPTLVASVCSLSLVTALLPVAKGYGPGGVAWVGVLSAITNTGVMFGWGAVRRNIFPAGETVKYVAKLLLVSTVAALSVNIAAAPSSSHMSLLHLFSAGALSLVAIFGVSFCLRLKEAEYIVAFVHWQLRRGQRFLGAL